MSSQRPPVAATASVLLGGTVVSVAALAAAFVAGLVGSASLSTLLSTAGVVALLATPAAGLFVSYFEMRPGQPRPALLTLVVLGVLAISTLVALLSR